MEGLVEQLLRCEPADPVLGAVSYLCESKKLPLPKECTKLVPKQVAEAAAKEKKEQKKVEVRVDQREETLKKVAAEKAHEKAQKRLDAEDGIDFASAF
ncbi:hypothetical protein DIPPA_32407 [Diplonema papillatum]|nr:hypothetical protein DIPPA_32407 [Diplonema papillatum]